MASVDKQVDFFLVLDFLVLLFALVSISMETSVSFLALAVLLWMVQFAREGDK